MTNADNTRRIAKNTLYLYGRMLIGMLVSLYTSRVVLQALGIDDFGINNVVGGFVAMFALVSSSLSSSISRFITFELGKGDMTRLQQVFATSLIIQIAMSVIVVILAESVGLWFLNTRMVIPEARIHAAHWVYQASIAAFVIGLLSCPYHAAIIAHERMDAFAAIGILDIFLKLAIAITISLMPASIDKLILYSMLTVSVSIAMQFVYITYCHRHFEESHAKLKFHRNTWKTMSGFAGWNAIGCTAGLLKDQGINILLNIFFGPVANAARGIASSIAAIATNFSDTFTTAINPQIVKSYAVSDHAYTTQLVHRGSRFSFYIMMIIAFPIAIDTPFLLKLWLGTYPPMTILFARLVITLSLIDILSGTLITLQVATGKIRNYQLAVGTVLMLNFPITYLLFRMGMPPYAAYITAIAIAVTCLVLRLTFLRNMAGLNMGEYMRKVCINVLTVSIIALLPPILLHAIMPEGFMRLICTTVISLTASLAAILSVGCSENERRFILDKLTAIRTRLPYMSRAKNND